MTGGGEIEHEQGRDVDEAASQGDGSRGVEPTDGDGARRGQDGPPSGKVWVESRSVAIGIGVSWGDGKLTFQGKDHVFNVNGLSVIDLGVSKVTANGEVFNLKKLSDFNGNYVAGTAVRRSAAAPAP